jgi:hypothetical protein
MPSVSLQRDLAPMRRDTVLQVEALMLTDQDRNGHWQFGLWCPVAGRFEWKSTGVKSRKAAIRRRWFVLMDLLADQAARQDAIAEEATRNSQQLKKLAGLFQSLIRANDLKRDK